MVLGFDPTTILVAVFTGSAVTALIGLISQRWLSSGRVRTTNADTLWQEATRQYQRVEQDNDRLRIEFNQAREDLFEVRTKLIDLAEQVSKATGEAGRWRERLREARSKIERLEAELRCSDENESES